MNFEFPRLLKPKLVQCFLIFLAIFTILRSIKSVSNYRLTQWLFNYQEGFLKRGLPGALLQWLHIPVNRESLTAISFILFALVTITFGLSIFRVYRNANYAGWAFIFFILALMNPGTLPHFAHDIGRFDGMGLILFILGLLTIEKLSSAISLPIVLAISIIMLLTHEAFFFVYLPPLLAFWVFKGTTIYKWIWAIGAFALLFVATYLISTHGVLRTDAEFNSLLSKKQAEIGSWVDPVSLVVIKSASLKENFELTLKNAGSKDKVIDHIKLLLFLLVPMYLVFGSYIRRLRRSLPNRLEVTVLFLSLFSALGLYPLGYDHFRWWALILTNFFVVSAFVTLHSPVAQRILAEEIHKRHKQVVALVILSSILGALSTYYAFG